jgi:hypothetical protein
MPDFRCNFTQYLPPHHALNVFERLHLLSLHTGGWLLLGCKL